MKNSFYTPSVFALIFTVFTNISAQKPMTISHSCNFAAADTAGQLYTYDASREAEGIIKDIMDAYSLPQNFVVKSADCKNALATSEGKQRYILYSTAFLENFKQEANTKWSAYSVLAHEIGHHLSNHDLAETDPSVRKRCELEADRFAGGVLFKMGATLVQTQAGINTFSLEGESTTHPAKRARLEAIAVGWKQAQELAEKAADSDGKQEGDSEEQQLFKKALAEKDPEQAINILTELLEINGNFTDAYLERGRRQRLKEDVRRNYNDAVEDLTAYLKIRTKDPIAYFERGLAYGALGKAEDAIKDFDRSLRYNPQNAEAYFERSFAKRSLEQDEPALKDLEAAIKIKPNYAEAHYQIGNVQYGLAAYDKAITAFDQCLKIDPQHYNALELRGVTKQFLERYAEAIADFKLLETRHPAEYTTYINCSQCYAALKQYKEAVAELTKSISKAPLSNSYQMSGYFEHYLYRGIYKALLKQEAAAETDFQAALKLKDTPWGSDYQKIGCLLVDYNLPKLAVPYLQKAVELQGESSPNSKACLAMALKNIKN